MALSKLPDQTRAIAALDLSGLLRIRLKDDQPSAMQIADHLAAQLAAHGTGEPPSLRIPSPMALAGFYRRSVLDVLDGLYELKQRRYDYVSGGLDQEVILHDPVNRRAHPHTCWPRLTGTWLQVGGLFDPHKSQPGRKLIPDDGR